MFSHVYAFHPSSGFILLSYIIRCAPLLSLTSKVRKVWRPLLLSRQQNAARPLFLSKPSVSYDPADDGRALLQQH